MMVTASQRKLTSKLTSYAAAAAAAFVARDSHAGIIYTNLGATGIEVTDLFDVDLNDDDEPDITLIKDGDRHIHCGGTIAPYCSIRSFSILRASGVDGALAFRRGRPGKGICAGQLDSR